MKINPGLFEMYKVPKEKYQERTAKEQQLVNMYDAMSTANPISYYFTPQDIVELNRMAKSPSLTLDMNKKLKAFDDFMMGKGFTLIGGGTNRRAYGTMYDNSITIKVATDSGGFTSNLKEYVNQHIIKPFCTKIYEVTPCGELSLTERVIPLENEEDIVSYRNEIFDTIFFYIRNKNIAMDDIGLRSMRNWGYRRGFGPVLLDFPSMYVVDPRKRFCGALLDNGTKKCSGSLDYDSGFDNIICGHCGRIIKAVELAKDDDDDMNQLIFAINNRNKQNMEGSKMKFSLVRKNADGTEEKVITTEVGGFTKSVDPYVPITTPRQQKVSKVTVEPTIKFNLDKHNKDGSIERGIDYTKIDIEKPDSEESKKESVSVPVPAVEEKIDKTIFGIIEDPDLLFDIILKDYIIGTKKGYGNFENYYNDVFGTSLIKMLKNITSSVITKNENDLLVKEIKLKHYDNIIFYFKMLFCRLCDNDNIYAIFDLIHMVLNEIRGKAFISFYTNDNTSDIVDILDKNVSNKDGKIKPKQHDASTTVYNRNTIDLLYGKLMHILDEFVYTYTNFGATTNSYDVLYNFYNEVKKYENTTIQDSVIVEVSNDIDTSVYYAVISEEIKKKLK